MRSAGFLLAFMVLFLSVQPVMAMMQQTEEASCAGGCCQQDGHDEDEPAGDPCGSTCNPFLACSSYASFPSNPLLLTVYSIDMPPSPAASLTQDIYSRFSVDFWQPPRIA